MNIENYKPITFTDTNTNTNKETIVPMTEKEFKYFANYLSNNDVNDDVNHPAHYTQYKGLEIIDLTEQMNFNRGNAVKYIARAGFKNKETELEDLQKAQWYIIREIKRIKLGLKL